MTPFKLGVLADVLAMEDAEEALDVIDEALRLTEQGERWSEAELVRIKGNVLLANDKRAAEECFRHSLQIAREQGARSWELRTATNLAQLWCARGKRDDARELLSPIHHWFSEGFETADLNDAKTLLHDLEIQAPSGA